MRRRYDEILEAAESRARLEGYNGFSFRDLADDVGVKSASVHYHFPTKAALMEALTTRYTSGFFAGLGDPADDATPSAELFDRFVGRFRDALVERDQMCLCGMLGAEITTLPEPVAHAVRAFFAQSQAWLTALFARAPETTEAVAASRADLTLAALEGALLVARTRGDHAAFERVVDHLRREL